MKAEDQSAEREAFENEWIRYAGHLPKRAGDGYVHGPVDLTWRFWRAALSAREAPAPAAPAAAKAVEMDAVRNAMALALEAMQDALEDAQLAQSEYDGRTYSFCTSCGADDLQTPTVGKHTPHCAWGKVLAAISELELQIAALSKQGGNHG